MRPHRPLRATLPAPVAALGGAVILVGALGACGDMTPPSISSGAATGSPAVGVDEGQGAPAVPTTGSDVSAVIGGWAAQYGSARNQVLAAVTALGSAGDASAVKAGAQDALTAVEDAGTLHPCPDASTEEAYRSDLRDLRSRLEQLSGSGDAASAAALAADAGTLFERTEVALTAAYS